MHIPRRDPELCWKVRVVPGEHAHALVRQGVEDVDHPDEEIGDADEQQSVVVEEAA